MIRKESEDFTEANEDNEEDGVENPIKTPVQSLCFLRFLL
jgi:hypothetical protein